MGLGKSFRHKFCLSGPSKACTRFSGSQELSGGWESSDVACFGHHFSMTTLSSAPLHWPVVQNYQRRHFSNSLVGSSQKKVANVCLLEKHVKLLALYSTSHLQISSFAKFQTQHLELKKFLAKFSACWIQVFSCRQRRRKYVAECSLQNPRFMGEQGRGALLACVILQQKKD